MRMYAWTSIKWVCTRIFMHIPQCIPSFHHRPILDFTDSCVIFPCLHSPPAISIALSTDSGSSVGGVRNARGIDGFRGGPDGFGDGSGISDGFDRRYDNAGGRAVGQISRAKLKAKGLFLRILEALPFQKLKILIGGWLVWGVVVWGVRLRRRFSGVGGDPGHWLVWLRRIRWQFQTRFFRVCFRCCFFAVSVFISAVVPYQVRYYNCVLCGVLLMRDVCYVVFDVSSWLLSYQIPGVYVCLRGVLGVFCGSSGVCFICRPTAVVRFICRPTVVRNNGIICSLLLSCSFSLSSLCPLFVCFLSTLFLFFLRVYI